MTIPENSPKDTKSLSQCNSPEANLDFAGFQSQRNCTQFWNPKAEKKCYRRDTRRECRVVCQTNNPDLEKTTARAVEERNNTTG
jgi:hypothetical protein